MKAQILKIAGVKTEAAFYKKYPTQEAFMKVHGKEFKKAQIGAYIGGDTNAAPKMIDYNTIYKAADKSITGMDDDMRQAQADNAAAAQAAQAANKGGGDTGAASGGGMGNIMSMLGGSGGESGGGIMDMLGGEGGSEGLMSILGGAKYGTNIPTAQYGGNFPPPIDSSFQGSPGYQQGYNNSTQAPSYQGPMNKSKNYYQNNNPYFTTNPGSTSLNNPAVASKLPESGFSDQLKGFTKYLGPAGDILEGIDALKQEKESMKAAQQTEQLSSLQLRASQTRPEMKERKYVRPEDVRNTGEEFFPIYGVGTNVLARNGARLQEGGMVGGNPTEIQNTYNDGYDIYTDGGYEPLQDPFQVKDFRHGGYLHPMQDGGSFDWSAAANFGTKTVNGARGGQNAGGKIGGTVGKSIGNAIVPGVGGAVGEFVGNIAGNYLDPYESSIKVAQSNTKRNTENIAFNQIAPSIQAGYASHMKDGGWVSNDWTPQVIAKFGELDAQDFADFAHKDQFRAGGHLKQYTPPSERAMETFAMGGQLQTHWGGEAETMSHNPYLPGSGETVLFRGQSHTDSDGKGNTGIGITYGDNPVEVERGEPMFEMQSGGEVNPETGEPENTGVVLGNMEINKKIASQFNDDELMAIADKYHGKKFKNVGIDLSKQEAKQNKIIDKSSDELDNLKVNTSFDKLKLSALKANIEGANLKLKDIANTKITLANYQNAINDTKEEVSDALGKNISAEHLAKGLIRIDKDPVTKDAKWGSSIVKKAKAGATTTKETTTPPKKSREQLIAEGYTKQPNGVWEKEHKGVKKPDTETKSASAMNTIPKQSVDKATGLYGGVTPEQFQAFKEKNKWYDFSNFDPNNPEDVDKYAKAFNVESEKRGSKARILPDVEIDPKTKKPVPGTKTKYVGKQFVSADLAGEKKSEEPINTKDVAIEDVPDVIAPSKPRFPWEIPVNAAIDYFRPTDQSELDYNQLLGETYALSNNQLDPVQAQLYHPELAVPYDISYQDVLNENQADYNAAQRMMGYNPAAQAALNAQKYQANQKVLGEQFRANQAMKAGVYDQNRNTLNQAKLTNLGILDKQYERQSQALSNTKATTQAALSSMSDKYAKNKLENRKLAIYENMYNYRFGQNGKAKNYNGLQFFDTDASGAKARQDEVIPPGYKVTGYDANRNPRLARITEKDTKEDEAALEAVGGIKDKNGGKHKKNYKNSSVVKAYKNL